MLSEYQSVWAFVFFDLPVKETAQRRRYTQFRALLLREGFSQLQYSVYARFFGSQKQSSPIRDLIRSEIPEDGYVRILVVTDRQFSKMENFFGRNEVKSEQPDEQFMLF